VDFYFLAFDGVEDAVEFCAGQERVVGEVLVQLVVVGEGVGGLGEVGD